MTNETEPRTPALQPCPNEECRGECYADTAAFSRAWQVFCARNCGYSGPAAATEDEAIELHNRMPRTEPWVSVAERMPEDPNQECYLAFGNCTVEGTLVWSGQHWHWSDGLPLYELDTDSTVTHWRPHTPPRGPVSR